MKDDLKPLSQVMWDAVIVGAGPAGSMAAALLAARGWRVVLVEKFAWPREKVCGGCLNAEAIRLLVDCGLGDAVRGAARLDGACWHAGHRSVRVSSPGGVAILRLHLDAQLVDIAINRGCEFLSGFSATLLPAIAGGFRNIRLTSVGGETIIRTRVVLACDGIAGKTLAHEAWARWRIAPKSLIGVSATFSTWPTDLQPGCVHMHVGRGGYVGLVCMPVVSKNLVHLAAALDPVACRRARGPGSLIQKILQSCRHDSPTDLGNCHFRGSTQLTRHRREIGGHRVLAIGDACGYVEPFTGQGIAWAIDSARCAVNLLPASPVDWPADLPSCWRSQYRSRIAARQRFCHSMRPVLRYPSLAAAAVFVTRMAPKFGDFAAQCVSRPRLT